jgi:hypothetical protein
MGCSGSKLVAAPVQQRKIAEPASNLPRLQPQPEADLAQVKRGEANPGQASKLPEFEFTELNEPARLGQSDNLKLLLASGADKDAKLATALRWALAWGALNNNWEPASILLDARPQLKQDYGATPEDALLFFRNLAATATPEDVSKAAAPLTVGVTESQPKDATTTEPMLKPGLSIASSTVPQEDNLRGFGDEIQTESSPRGGPCTCSIFGM